MTVPAHPYRLDTTRQLAGADVQEHIADLVRTVLLTGPGERLHRPGFGAGLGAATIFEPADEALRAVVEVRARGALQHELGERIELVSVAVRADSSTLLAEVVYRIRPTGSDRRVVVTSGRAAR